MRSYLIKYLLIKTIFVMYHSSWRNYNIHIQNNHFHSHGNGNASNILSQITQNLTEFGQKLFVLCEFDEYDIFGISWLITIMP